MNGLNSCAIDLRQIGRAIDAETHDGGFHGPQLDADVRQPEIDDEELREGRGATQELGIDIGEAAEDRDRDILSRAMTSPSTSASTSAPAATATVITAPLSSRLAK